MELEEAEQSLKHQAEEVPSLEELRPWEAHLVAAVLAAPVHLEAEEVPFAEAEVALH